MKTQPYHPRRQRSTLRLLLDLLLAISLFFAVFLLTGCTVTVAPDGSKSGTVDSASFLRAIEIISTK